MQTARASTALPSVSDPSPDQGERRAELRALRKAEDARVRGIRLRRACEALTACGFPERAAWLAADINELASARHDLGSLRDRLADGSDESRRIKLGTALDLLGSLWCVS